MQPLQRASYVIHLVLNVPGPAADDRPILRSVQAAQRLAQLLPLLDSDPVYRHLLLDGTAAPIENLLRFYPERYEQIEAFVQDGRLQIGPFLTMPDMFLLDPESIIRNLQLGLATARLFGPAPTVVYLANPTGQIAQLPQILRGFGFTAAFVTHGLASDYPALLWSAPDGSRIALAQVWRPAGTVTGRAAWLRETIAPRAANEHLLLMHTVSNRADVIALVDQIAQAADSSPDMIRQSTLGTFAASLETNFSLPKEAAIAGKLRNPERTPIYPGSLTAQSWVKAAMHALESDLIRRAEPLSVWIEQAEDETVTAFRPRALLRQAWRALAINQAWPIIGGLSALDPDEVRLHFRTARQFGAVVIDHGLARLAAQVDWAALEPDLLNYIVFNPSGTPRTERVTVPDAETGKSVHFLARDVPPFGYALIAPDAFARLRVGPDSDLVVENDLIRAWVEPIGPTLSVHDKVRDVTYRRLIVLRCEGDEGDTYNFAPIGRGIQNSRDLHADDLQSEHTTVYDRLTYSAALSLDPAPEMEPPGMVGDLNVSLRVEIEMLLVRDVPRLDLRITVYNTVPELYNYRIRAHFLLDNAAQTAFYDQAWHIEQRAIEDLPALSPPEGWAEAPLSAQPVRSFVAAFNTTDAENGLIIANRGAHEAEIVLDEEDRLEIAITLLRALNHIVRADVDTRDRSADPGPARADELAKMSGLQTTELSLIPSDFKNRFAGYAQAWAYADGDLAAVAVDLQAVQTGDSLPGQASIARASNPLFRITAARLPDDPERSGLIARGVSYAETDIEIRLTPWRRYAVCDVVRIDETETGGKLAIEQDGSVVFYAAPARVLTLWFHD